MDAPFPAGMMPDIQKFFREVHPTLPPGRDWYPEVFATEYFFPLQRPRELAAMVRAARRAGPPCEDCVPDRVGTAATGVPLDMCRVDCLRCGGRGTAGPVTVMEVGADKGGGLYHWCQCLPTVRNIIGCEVRGLPYAGEFGAAFPDLNFSWHPTGSLNAVASVADTLAGNAIDVLFIDGDKLGMWQDFQAYLPLLRRPGGVVFMHDVSDDHPAQAFKAVVRAGFRTDLIINRSEGLEAGVRADAGEAPLNNHDGWLMHWRGRSCGVGVVYL